MKNPKTTSAATLKKLNKLSNLISSDRKWENIYIIKVDNE